MNRIDSRILPFAYRYSDIRERLQVTPSDGKLPISPKNVEILHLIDSLVFQIDIMTEISKNRGRPDAIAL